MARAERATTDDRRWFEDEKLRAKRERAARRALVQGMDDARKRVEALPLARLLATKSPSEVAAQVAEAMFPRNMVEGEPQGLDVRRTMKADEPYTIDPRVQQEAAQEPERVGKAVDFDDPVSLFEKVWRKVLRDAHWDAKRITFKRSREDFIASAGFDPGPFSFGATYRQGAQWAADAAAELVREITRDQVSAITDLIVESFERGVPPRTTAKRIRDVVGLHSRQVRAWDNRYQRLIEQGFGKSDVEKMMSSYAKKLHKQRAESIARTEILRAQGEGRRDGWSEAKSGGFLPDDTRREWLAAVGSNRTCPICEALDGERTDVDGQYPGGFSGPPAHPMCRCSERLIFEGINDDEGRGRGGTPSSGRGAKA